MKKLRRFSPLIGLLTVLFFILMLATPAFALTTADVTVNATPAYVSIAVNNATYSFGVINTSSITNTSIGYFVIDNTSTVQTDQTIAVVNATWNSAGTGWTHDDNCTQGDNTAGMKATKGVAWGTSDVLVQKVTPEYIAENQALNTDYSFGLSLWAPTIFTDSNINSMVVRVTAAAG
jgi:hypothetical protein